MKRQNAIRELRYVTCVRGREFKGRAAHANHARKCPQEIARSETFIARIETSNRGRRFEAGR